MAICPGSPESPDQVLDVFIRDRRGSRNPAGDLAALLQEQLGQVGAILSVDADD